MPAPKKNVAYEFDIALIDTADTGAFRVNPTIAAGDFKVSTDNTAFTNLATLPVVSPAGSILVKINLSAAEMNGDKVMIQCVDAAGNEWDDVLIFIDATAVMVEDIVRSTTPANTLDVTATGAAGIDWANVEGQGTTVNLSATTTNLVNTTTTNTDMRGTDGASTHAASAIWAIDATTQQTQGTFGQAIGDPVADTNTIYSRLDADITSRLAPTVAARTLDVTVGGTAGIDWANIEAPTTVVDLAGTDINLVDTTTTNTDMRGTDSALLAASAPTNFGDLSIAVTTGLVDITQVAADKAWSTTTRALTTGGIGSGVIAAAELLNIADGCLDRRLDLGADTGGDTTTSRTWRQALRTARNRVVISAGTMTVFEEDDTTAAYTAVITTTAGDPITELNPA